MAKAGKPGMPSWLPIAFTGLVFFGIGGLTGIAWQKSRVAAPTPSPSTSALAFPVPEIPLPPNWGTKEGLPGNSFATSFTLLPGIKTQGTFSSDNVIDYYVFSIKNPAQIILNVTDIPQSLYWVLYDANYKQVAASYRTGATEGESKIALQNPGTYYIKTWADYSKVTNYPYTIRLSVLPFFE